MSTYLNLKLVACAIAVCTLAACTNPLDTVATIQGSYNAALAGEISWLATGPKAADVIAVERARSVAAAVIDPMSADAAAGKVPASDTVFAAQAAISALQAAIVTYGIGNK